MAEFFKVSDAVTVRVIELDLPSTLDVDEFDKLNDSLLREFVASDGRWILDLTKVDYVGSAVLGMMVNIRQHVKAAAGKLVLCGLSPRLPKVTPDVRPDLCASSIIACWISSNRCLFAAVGLVKTLPLITGYKSTAMP